MAMLWFKVSGAISILSLTTLAQAQTPTQDELKAETVEEIVVTAQGRTESLQDVPIAINAISGSVLQSRGLTTIENFAPQVPSIRLAESPFQRTVAIRGLGSTGGNIGYEQSAPLFIDGLFAGRGGQLTAPFFDLERIEIVKGPQAIFFGKNATAGAMSLVSARPTATFYGRVYGGYEIENGGYVGEAVLSGPLTDTLSARVSGHLSRRGNYLYDTSANKEVGKSDAYAGRVSLLWEPSSDVSLYLKGEYSETKADRRIQSACANTSFTEIALSASQAAQLGGPVECRLDRNLSSGASTGLFASAYPSGSDFDDNKSANVVLKGTWQLGEHSLESTTGYNGFDTVANDGPDRTSLSIAVFTGAQEFDQYSQEFRLLSPTGGRIEYVVGGTYIFAKHRSIQTVAQLLPGAVGDHVAVVQESDAYSGFGRLTWNINEQLSLAIGGRYTHEVKNFDSVVTRTRDNSQIAVLNYARLPTGTVQIFTQERSPGVRGLRRSEASLDPSATLTWKPSNDVLLYGTVARGTKAGGFEFFSRAFVMGIAPFQTTGLDPASLEYEAEKALNYEIGFKTDLADRRLHLNGAAFYNDLKDLQNQVVNINNLGFVTFNFDARIYGAELDGYWRLDDNVKIGGAMTVLDTKLTSGQYAGNRLPFAAKFSGNAYIDGNFELRADLAINTRVQVNRSGGVAFDASNEAADNSDGYTTIDARLGVAVGKRWEFAVSARNLLDKDDIVLFSSPTLLSSSLSSNPRGVLIDEGRTIMLTAKAEF